MQARGVRPVACFVPLSLRVRVCCVCVCVASGACASIVRVRVVMEASPSAATHESLVAASSMPPVLDAAPTVASIGEAFLTPVTRKDSRLAPADLWDQVRLRGACEWSVKVVRGPRAGAGSIGARHCSHRGRGSARRMSQMTVLGTEIAKLSEKPERTKKELGLLQSLSLTLFVTVQKLAQVRACPARAGVGRRGCQPCVVPLLSG